MAPKKNLAKDKRIAIQQGDGLQVEDMQGKDVVYDHSSDHSQTRSHELPLPQTVETGAVSAGPDQQALKEYAAAMRYNLDSALALG